MRARELLTALTIPSQGQAYQYLLHQQGGKTVKITSIHPQEKLLLFSYEEQKPPLAMRELLISLMTHRNLPLYFWDGKQAQPIYGFKEEQDAVII